MGCGLEDWIVKVRLSNILTTCAEFRTVHSLDFALRCTIAIKIQSMLPGQDRCPSSDENVRGPIRKAIRGFWPSSSKEKSLRVKFPCVLRYRLHTSSLPS